MVLGLFTKTEGRPAEGADWRDALKNAEKTEPPQGLLASVVKKMPLDTAATAARRAHNRVTDAQAAMIRAEMALEKSTKELAEAMKDRERLQCHLLKEMQASGALEACPYVDFKTMPAEEASK